jgi:hypothetical protein
MKKFALAALTAVVATVSLSTVAEARRRHFDDFGGWDRPHHRHWDDYGYGRDFCSTTKIIKRDDWGNKVVKIIKRCG